jgi:glycosyltransferase involved in cell wall biosynthesis
MSVERGPPSVLYVLKRYPRLSETFITRELLELEAFGCRLGVDSLLPQEDGPRHADVDRVRAEIRYLPRRPKLTDRDVLVAHLRSGMRRPLRWSSLAFTARRKGGWRQFVQAGLVADRVRRESFDSLHAHFATAAADVARDAAALSGRPFTITAHAKDIYHDDNARSLPDRVRGAATVVTVSAFNMRHLASRLPASALAMIPNGVPSLPLVPTRPGNGHAGPVLCVARLVEKKGIDVLIDAVGLLTAEHPDLVVEIIGGGPLDDALRARARTAGVDGVIRFLGPQPSDVVDAAYLRCAMVVLPCRVAANGDRDGMPTVILEAMARGLPVVSTNVVGISEAVRPGRTGLLVPPDDPPALAVAIGDLLKDADMRNRLGAAGRELVSKHYDPGRSAAMLLDVFAGARR